MAVSSDSLRITLGVRLKRLPVEPVHTEYMLYPSINLTELGEITVIAIIQHICL